MDFDVERLWDNFFITIIINEKKNMYPMLQKIIFYHKK